MYGIENGRKAIEEKLNQKKLFYVMYGTEVVKGHHLFQ